MARERQNNRLDRSVIDPLFALYRKGDFRQLAESSASLLKKFPDELVLHSLHGAACLELGDYDSAITSYKAALAIKPDFEKINNSLGIAYLRMRQFGEATRCFKKAVESNPGFAPAWFNLGIVYENGGEWKTAAELYRKAAELNPDYAEAFNSLGTVYWEMGEHNQVADCYEKALEIRHDYVSAYRNLMNFHEKSNDHEELKAALDRAGNALGEHAVVRFYAGVVAEIDGDYERAEKILNAVEFDPNDPQWSYDERARLARLAGICDRLDKPREAFGYASEANRLSRELDSRNGIRKKPYLEAVEYRQKYFSRDNIGKWPEKQGSTPEESRPVFIIGFPRSGTTLLDMILRSHPRIQVAEECDAVPLMIAQLARLGNDHLNQLSDLDPDTLRELRKLYLDRLEHHLQPVDESVRLIDRSALNTIHAGEICRIFPEAGFIFMLRHPADSILSCFMQTFYPSEANANFHSLEDAASLYDRLLSLWQQYTEVLDMNVLYVRYEDLIGDIEQACRPVLDFIDMDWHPALLDYQKTARERELIRTASYNQVTQKLYSHADGRWKRYREAMETVLPVIEPWAKKFGYTV